VGVEERTGYIIGMKDEDEEEEDTTSLKHDVPGRKKSYGRERVEQESEERWSQGW
jgi:hypothetical protein